MGQSSNPPTSRFKPSKRKPSTTRKPPKCQSPKFAAKSCPSEPYQCSESPKPSRINAKPSQSGLQHVKNSPSIGGIRKDPSFYVFQILNFHLTFKFLTRFILSSTKEHKIIFNRTRVKLRTTPRPRALLGSLKVAVSSI